MPGLRRPQESKDRYYTACKCCLSIFTNKASHHKQRQLDWCFLSLRLLLKYIFCFRNCLVYYMFYCVFCRNVAKLFILVQLQSKLLMLLLTMVSGQPYLLYTNSSFSLRFSQSQEMLKNLGQVCQNSKQNLRASFSLPSSTRAFVP